MNQHIKRDGKILCGVNSDYYMKFPEAHKLSENELRSQGDFWSNFHVKNFPKHLYCQKCVDRYFQIVKKSPDTKRVVISRTASKFGL